MSPSAYHRDVAALTAAHNRRLSSLDPDLGPVPVPDVDGARAVLVARGAVGIWSHQEVHDADLSALWGGRSQDLLAVRSGHGIAPVLGCLLDQLDLIRGTAAPDGDAEVVVRLPALEPGVAPVLLERGLRPVSQTALLRVAPEVPATEEDAVGTVGTRAATPDDVDAVAALLREMHESDVAWGSGYLRPTTASYLRRLAEEACARDGWTWIAEEGGAPIGVVSLQGAEEAAWATGATSLQPAHYLGLMAVTATARRHGTGRRLVALAHRAAAERGARAIVLDHAALSLLSATFWHRRGYRPLWTTWVRRG